MLKADNFTPLFFRHYAVALAKVIHNLNIKSNLLEIAVNGGGGVVE